MHFPTVVSRWSSISTDNIREMPCDITNVMIIEMLWYYPLQIDQKVFSKGAFHGVLEGVIFEFLSVHFCALRGAGSFLSSSRLIKFVSQSLTPAFENTCYIGAKSLPGHLPYSATPFPSMSFLEVKWKVYYTHCTQLQRFMWPGCLYLFV